MSSNLGRGSWFCSSVLAAKRELSRYSVWVLALLVALVTAFYYVPYNDWRPVWPYFVFELKSNAIGVLYFVPLAYAALRLDVRRCLVTWFVCFIIVLPIVTHYTFSFSSLARNVLLLASPPLVAALVSSELRRRQRERELLMEREREQQRYVDGVLAAQEEERRRIALELHDETIHSLLAAAHCIAVVGKGDGVDRSSAEALESIQKELSRTAVDLRRISYDLRPSMLDNLGLVPALDWLSRRVMDFDGPSVDIQTNGRSYRLSSRTEIAVFRIVQEALNNAVRHSQAEHIDISICFRDVGLEIAIADDGQGISRNQQESESRQQDGIGILGMRFRAAAIGGELTIESTANMGTVVRLIVPARDAPQANEPQFLSSDNVEQILLGG